MEYNSFQNDLHMDPNNVNNKTPAIPTGYTLVPELDVKTISKPRPNSQFNPKTKFQRKNFIPLNNMRNIRKQLEYYFSDINLVKDSFIKSKMDRFGFVNVNVISEFRRIQAAGIPTDVILKSAARSENIEVVGNYLRSKKTWYKHIPMALDELPPESNEYGKPDELSEQQFEESKSYPIDTDYDSEQELLFQTFNNLNSYEPKQNSYQNQYVQPQQYPYYNAQYYSPNPPFSPDYNYFLPSQASPNVNMPLFSSYSPRSAYYPGSELHNSSFNQIGSKSESQVLFGLQKLGVSPTSGGFPSNYRTTDNFDPTQLQQNKIENVDPKNYIYSNKTREQNHKVRSRRGPSKKGKHIKDTGKFPKTSNEAGLDKKEKLELSSNKNGQVFAASRKKNEKGKFFGKKHTVEKDLEKNLVSNVKKKGKKSVERFSKNFIEGSDEKSGKELKKVEKDEKRSEKNADVKTSATGDSKEYKDSRKANISCDVDEGVVENLGEDIDL